MRRMLAPLAVTLVALAAVLAPGAGASSSADKNLVATAAGAGQFKTLASLLTKSGLAMTLEGKGPYTVFAPTDTAFAKVPKATLAKLGKDKALPSVLLSRVVKEGAGEHRRHAERQVGEDAERRLREIAVRGGTVYLNGSTKVTKTDVMASNGIIHVIDKVLLPPAS